MDSATVDKEMPVALQEKCGCQAFGGFLHLRVGEGEPYLRHFFRCKKFVNEFYVQKYIVIFIYALSAGMQKCSFCSIYTKLEHF